MTDLPAPNLATPDANASDLKSARRQTSVYVYEAPVRIWHWTNALAIVVLIVTGYFIGSPPPTMGAGEAYNQFYFGYIRFTHFAAGMILTVGFFGRIYWAFVGNTHARQMFTLPVTNRRWWYELIYELRWYMFMVKEPKKYVGHNPMAHAAMFFFMTLGISFMMITGWALYAEGAGQGSLPDTAMGWLLGWIGNSQILHMLHRFGMWSIVIFVLIHVYAALREDIMSRQSTVSTMLSGHRTFKDDRPD